MSNTRQLKIAQITPYYYPSIGGVEKVVQIISEGLVERGHLVDVLTTSRNHKGEASITNPATENINGVNVFRYKSYLHLGHMSVFPGSFSRIKKEKYNVIHSHALRHPHTLYWPFIAKNNGCTAVLHGHSHFFNDSIPFPKLLLYRAFDKIVFKSAYNKYPLFFTNTQIEKKQFIKLGLEPKDIQIIPPPVLSDEYFEKVDTTPLIQKHNLQNKRIILFIGHFHADKKVDLLIKALPALVKKDSNTMLLLIGPDNGHYPAYKKMARELKVEQNMKWLGRVSDIEKRQALAACEVFILPSIYESFGIVLIEAMAAGKPVIAAESPGPIEIIEHEKNGILIPKNSVQSIVTQTSRIFDDKILAEKIGRNGKEKVQATYRASHLIDNVEKAYFSTFTQNLARTVSNKEM